MNNIFPAHEPGPLFPDEEHLIADQMATFLNATDERVASEVEQENIKDLAESSFLRWAEQVSDGQDPDIAAKPPKNI